MKSILATGVMAGILSLSACGSNSKTNRDSNPQKPIQLEAKTPEEALNMLTADQRKSFEDWKLKLVKTCDPHSALGVAFSVNEPLPSPILDAGLLLGNENPTIDSIVIQGKSGEVAFLGSPALVSDEKTVNIDSPELKAKTQIVDSQCTLTLFNQVVYQSRVATSILLQAYWPGEKLQSSQVGAPPRSVLGRASGLSEVYLHPVAYALEETLSPGQKAFQFLASHFKMDEFLVRNVFHPGLPRNLNYSFKIVQIPTPFWVNVNYSNLIDKYPLQNGKFEVEMQIPVKHLKSNYKIVAAFEAGISAGDARKYVYELKNLTSKGVVLQDPSEAVECFKNRVNVIRSARSSNISFQPSYREAIEPCLVLHSDLDRLVQEEGAFRDQLQTMFSGVIPNFNVNYNGWEEAAQSLILKLERQGKDIRAELDPKNTFPLIQEIARYLDLQKEFLKTDGATIDSAIQVRIAYLQMGMHWAFSGQKLAQDRVLKISRAIAKLLPEQQEAALFLIQDFSKDSNTGEDQINFIESQVTSGYRQSIQKISNLAKKIPFSHWETGVLPHIIQQKVQQGQLDQWLVTLQAGAEFIQKEKFSSGKQEEQDNQQRLLKKAFGEFWGKLEFETLEKVAELARRSSSCSFTNPSSIILCRNESLFSRYEGLLSTSYKGRYGILAAELAVYLDLLGSHQEDEKVRTEVVDAFFNPKGSLWFWAEDPIFNQKADQLKSALMEFSEEKRPAQKAEIYLRIQKSLL